MRSLDVPLYGLDPEEKAAVLLPEIVELTEFHRRNCQPYSAFMAGEPGPFESLEDVPFLPVSVFKHLDLVSVPDTEVAQVVQSSSTTGKAPSRVFVDAATTGLQKQAATRILSDRIGEEPRPYIVFDHRKSASGRSMTARGAAAMAAMHLASKFFFVMKEGPGGLELDLDAFHFALEHARASGSFIAYGATPILHEVHRKLASGSRKIDGPWDPGRTFLLHSGGWKKLQALAVGKAEFDRDICTPWSLPPGSIVEFYGMAELVGVLFVECELGAKHVPAFSEVIVRDPETLLPLAPGEVGLLQFLSALGRGGPTHSILTEDLGTLERLDGCPCGRRGRTFRMIGRAPRAESRGCGDLKEAGT